MADLGAAWHAMGHVLVAGNASAEALVLDEPLSFWGGLDAASGAIVDTHHPQRGATISGRVLVMPGGRGSSSSSSVLAEALQVGTGPAAIVLSRADEIVVLGAFVPQLLGGAGCPVVVLKSDDYARLASGDMVEIDGQGRITVKNGRLRVAGG